jgi:hypothetical protein
MTRSIQATSRLATVGAAATLVYPALVVALQLVQRGHYDPMSQAISELALGPHGWLMTVAFCSLAVGTFILAALMRAVTRTRIAPTLLGVSGVLTVVSAFVHTDGSNGTSLHGQIHIAAGILTFVVIIVAMFLLVPRLRALPAWRRLGTVTLALAILGVVAFFLVPVLGDDYMGLAQRSLIGVLIGWNAIAQLYARRVFTTQVESSRSVQAHRQPHEAHPAT